jgi:hypothetical protein
VEEEGRPGEPVVVEFELTPEEWVEVSLQHASKSPQIRQARRMVRLLVGAIVVLAALLSILDGAASAGLVWLIAGVVVMAFMGPILRSSQRHQIRKHAEGGITNGMFGPHRVELRPEGMLDSTDGYEWLARWSSIERVEDGEGCFLIYTGPNALLPIPHTAFRDSESLRRFSHAFFTFKEESDAERLSGPAAEGPGSGEPL